MCDNNERVEDQLEEDYRKEPDDGMGPYDQNEGCSYCGYWQCSGNCE